MAVNNFKPTVWVANLLVALRNALVSEAGVNHNYEGEVIGAGSVKINTIGKTVLRDYTGADITYDDISTEVQTLNIDHNKYFAQELDDADDAQVKSGGELMIKAMENAAYAIANDRDAANFKAMSDGAGVVVGTDDAPIKVTSAETAKNLVLSLKTKADVANVSKNGRVLFASPQLENFLLADQTIGLAAPTANDVIRTGYIGKLYGIEIYSTNNLPQTDNKNDVVILTHPDFTTEASQVNKMEALRSTGSFKDLVRGLDVSGRKVIIPEGVVKAIVSYVGE